MAKLKDDPRFGDFKPLFDELFDERLDAVLDQKINERFGTDTHVETKKVEQVAGETKKEKSFFDAIFGD